MLLQLLLQHQDAGRLGHVVPLAQGLLVVDQDLTGPKEGSRRSETGRPSPNASNGQWRQGVLGAVFSPPAFVYTLQGDSLLVSFVAQLGQLGFVSLTSFVFMCV